MDTPYIYEIRVEGRLADRWSDWFDGLEVCPEEEGGTLLRGPIQDQSALLGLLTKVHALNLVLVSVQRKDD